MKKGMLVFCVLATQVVVATPAAAVPGLVRPIAVSETNSESPKVEIARCPQGKRVIGGGAWVFAISQSDETKVMLTGLQPLRDTVGRDGYMAVGYERAAGIDGNWWLKAYAICADPLAGLQIVTGTTDPSSSTFKIAAARCPGPMKVLGTGARVPDTSGQVGLQLTRSSTPRDISRATAREDAAGYGGRWTLTSYAVCAFNTPLTPLGGQPIATLPSLQNVVFANCPRGFFVHGAGGGGRLTDPGPFFLQVVYPFNDLDKVEVAMTGVPNGGMVAQAVCAL
jgi:hypothetical protein